MLNNTQGGISKVLTKQGAGQRTYPCPNCNGLQHCGWGLAVFGHWCRMHCAPVLLPRLSHCCCQPPHDAFYLYFIDLLQELEMHSKYFSETWCYGGTTGKEESMNAVRGKGWGTAVGISRTQPTPSQPSSAQHTHSDTLLMRYFETLRAPL